MKTFSGNKPKPLNPALQWTLFIVGCIAIVLAIIGMFLPLLPTVPFLLLALGCFGRSSERFYLWLLNHNHLGPLVRPYLQGRGIPRATKIKAIALIWISITISVILVSNLWMQGGLLIIALCVTLYLLRLPMDNPDQQGDLG